MTQIFTNQVTSSSILTRMKINEIFFTWSEKKYKISKLWKNKGDSRFKNDFEVIKLTQNNLNAFSNSF